MAARGVQGLIAVTALMGLAACGSVSAGSTGHPASASASSSKAPAAAAVTPAGHDGVDDRRDGVAVPVNRMPDRDEAARLGKEEEEHAIEDSQRLLEIVGG